MFVFGMVLIGWSFFLFFFPFFNACNQTHRHRPHGSLRSAKCWADGKTETNFIEHNQTNKMWFYSHFMTSTSSVSTLNVKWSKERVEGDRKSPCNVERERKRSPIFQPGEKAPASSSPFNPTLCACPSKLVAHDTPQIIPSLLLPLFHYIYIPSPPHKPSHAFRS